MKKMKWKVIFSAAAVLTAVVGIGTAVRAKDIKAQERTDEKQAYVEQYEEGVRAVDKEDCAIKQYQYIPSEATGETKSSFGEAEYVEQYEEAPVDTGKVTYSEMSTIPKELLK